MNFADSISKAILRKSIDWSYEKEIRFLMERSKNVGFPVTAIREVNFGYRTQPRHMVNLMHLVKTHGYKNCNFFKACIRNESYSVGFTPISFDEAKKELLATLVHKPFSMDFKMEK